MNKLEMELESDRIAVFRRRFNANPLQVYTAHLDSEIIAQWMTGPPGWHMVSCECDARPNGKFRYEWRNGSEAGFHIAGEFLELDPGKMIRHVEQMFVPDPTPKNEIQTTFTPDGEGTLMLIRIKAPDPESMTAMMNSGMEAGMAMNYQRLADMRATQVIPTNSQQ